MGFLDFFREKQATPKFQLSNLIEILQDGVCISNLNGDIIYMNHSAYQLLQIPMERDLNELNFFNDFIIDEENIKKIKIIIHKENLVKNFELRLSTLNSQVLDIILTINFIGDYRDQSIGFLFLFKDITEIKKIHQQLLQSQKLESVGLMASGIAHDFNNILAAIIPNAELIKLSVTPESENYKRAKIIETSALRASDIAKKLLTFTRDQEQQKRPVNFNTLLKESLELVQNILTKIIYIHLDFDEQLYSIYADGVQMQQVIMNLLINARDAMPKGGVIRLKTRNHMPETELLSDDHTNQPFIKFEIEDGGTGIPIEIIPKIFDPFFTTKEIGKGTGLGLSMVYGIVKSHGGTINVYSEEGNFTRFEILLPVDKKYVVQEKKPMPRKEIQKGLVFMVVDDEEYVRDILADILKFLGCDVVKASNGKEAIDIYSRKYEKINYVIVDLRMPKLDGRATLTALRQINPKINAIFTSGFDDRSNEKEDFPEIIGFLRKPYSIRNVSDSLQKFIRNEN